MTTNVSIHLSPSQVLLGAAAAFLLGGYAFASGWCGWAGLFSSHPLLSLPCTFSLFAGPLLLYVSIRRMMEAGLRGGLLAAFMLSAAALSLTALGLRFWLQGLAG